MTVLQYSNPLQLPAGWQRTPPGAARANRQFSQTMTMEDALRYLQDEVDALGAHQAVLSTNYASLTSQNQRSKRGQSEGASLRLGLEDGMVLVACDCWHSVVHNIYALQLAVRHARLMEEWGVGTAQQVLRALGMASSSAGSEAAIPECLSALGLGTTATLQDANAVYRQRAKLIGHDEAALIELNRLIEQARHLLS